MSNPNSPVITLVNNQLRTNSIDVAAYFGKQHRNVIRDIRNIMANCPESFNALNFELVETMDAKGEMRPSYSLTKDAFMLVVMGFTGHKAMQCKLAYIAEFNRMTDELSKRPLQLPAARLEPSPLPETFTCPYFKQSSPFSQISALSKTAEIETIEQSIAEYDQLRVSIGKLVRNTVQMVSRLAIGVEDLAYDLNDRSLHWLAHLLDPQHNGRCHGFSNSMFSEMDQTMKACRASIKFFQEVQVKA